MVNMIAAGEVIERPASVVKELLENSIDAGADTVAVTIADGGRKLIRVADNGCGMDADDLAAAFEPHATSKVRTSADLHRISTLGFRGEALASIASVASVRAVSRTRGSPAANRIEIDCGQKSEVRPCSGDYGTTIEVRDLFYKMPARRKFLRTANTEASHIVEQFTRAALANPDVTMSLEHNGRQLYHLPAGQGTRRRIAELLSSEIADNLIETHSNEKGLEITALMGKPNIARTSSKFQYVFLNGRFVRDRFISHAIKEAYRGIIDPDRFPVVFLFICIDCDQVDVNVHPTKIEVRFYNANLVHSQILAVLRERLLSTGFETMGELPAAEAARADDQKLPEGPAREKIAAAMAEFFRKHKPVRQHPRLNYAPPAAIPGPAAASTEELKALQIHDSYIVAQIEDGLVIIDQHALHERILHAALSRKIRAGKLESQRLLVPETLELTDAQADAINNHSQLLEKLGLELVPFGRRTIAVQAFPVLMGDTRPAEFVRDLLDILTDKGLTEDAEKMLDTVLNMAACKAAIKAGQKLSNSEIQELLAARREVEHAGRCPHGRPTTIKFTMAELERQFGRT